MTTRRQTLKWMAGAAAVAAMPAVSLAAKKGLYDRSLVIDALCFGKDWGEEAFVGLAQAGYSGIIESLNRNDLQTAIDELLMWRGRVAEHSDQLILALFGEVASHEATFWGDVEDPKPSGEEKPDDE